MSEPDQLAVGRVINELVKVCKEQGAKRYNIPEIVKEVREALKDAIPAWQS